MWPSAPVGYFLPPVSPINYFPQYSFPSYPPRPGVGFPTFPGKKILIFTCKKYLLNVKYFYNIIYFGSHRQTWRWLQKNYLFKHFHKTNILQTKHTYAKSHYIIFSKYDFSLNALYSHRKSLHWIKHFPNLSKKSHSLKKGNMIPNFFFKSCHLYVCEMRK